MERNEVFFVIVHLLCSFHLLFEEVFRFLLRFYFVVVPLKNLFREFNFVLLKLLGHSLVYRQLERRLLIRSSRIIHFKIILLIFFGRVVHLHRICKVPQIPDTTLELFLTTHRLVILKDHIVTEKNFIVLFLLFLRHLS